MSDEEFTTYQPKIMAFLKLNNRRRKAKAAFLAARADYEAVKAELSRTKAEHLKMYEEINSDDTPNEASVWATYTKIKDGHLWVLFEVC